MPDARGAKPPQAIVEAALAVAAQEGLGGATLGRVARRAGTSKASVLYHFGSLVGLRLAMAVRTRERIQDLVFHAAAPASGETEARGQAILDELFREEHRDFFRAMYEVRSLGARDERVAEEVRNSFERATWITALLLGPPVETALETAQQTVATVQGQLDLWLCWGDADPAPFRRAAERATRALVAQRARSGG